MSYKEQNYQLESEKTIAQIQKELRKLFLKSSRNRGFLQSEEARLEFLARDTRGRAQSIFSRASYEFDECLGQGLRVAVEEFPVHLANFLDSLNSHNPTKYGISYASHKIVGARGNVELARNYIAGEFNRAKGAILVPLHTMTEKMFERVAILEQDKVHLNPESYKDYARVTGTAARFWNAHDTASKLITKLEDPILTYALHA